MNQVNLRTADGLKKACLELETRSSDVNRTWRDELGQFLTEVREASVEARAARKFQERLWEDNPISAFGMGRVNVERAVEDEEFRLGLPRFRGRVRTWVSSALLQLSPLVVDG